MTKFRGITQTGQRIYFFGSVIFVDFFGLDFAWYYILFLGGMMKNVWAKLPCRIPLRAHSLRAISGPEENFPAFFLGPGNTFSSQAFQGRIKVQKFYIPPWYSF